MKNLDLPKSIEANGIRFELKDNGVQRFYTTRSGGVVYDVIQNHGQSVWWVMAHKGSATLTLNRPGTSTTIRPEASYNQPGVLYQEGCQQQPVDYWLSRLADYIQQRKDPFSAKNFKEG